MMKTADTVFRIFVILVISRFGFEGWICAMIASVPGLCILFTFIYIRHSGVSVKDQN